MTERWSARLQAVQDHVRSHLDGDLSVDALTAIAGGSRFHVARLFKEHTGETLVQFVQRARLERAATLMKARPDRPLLDVALQVGFKSASDFSRVFRQRHGIAPSRWDRRSRLSEGIPDYEDHLAAARDTCVPHVPRHVALSAHRLACVRVATPFFDNALLAEGYAELTGWFEAHGVDWRALSLVGMSWDHPETTPLPQVRFDLGLSLPEGLEAGGALSEVSLPGGEAVALRVQGSKACIAVAWKRLYRDVLPHADRDPADLPAFKRFRSQPCDTGWEVFDLDCLVALA